MLPEGDAKASWVYWWNQTSFTGGHSATPPCKIPTAYVWRILQGGVPTNHVVRGITGGQWLDIDVTAIGDFPLFFRRPK